MDRPPFLAAGPSRNRPTRRLLLPALMLAAAVWACGAATPGDAESARLRVDTDLGAFTLEFLPAEAPRTVSRVLELVRAGAYDGALVCEARGGGFLVLGCVAADAPGRPLTPVPSPAGWPDEIDARALGLDRRELGDVRAIELLWQLEIYPRYRTLVEEGRSVPAGLERLVTGLREHGMAATSVLSGKSRLWYLHALGFSYASPGSKQPVRRGAVATASLWPGEADARFLIALADLPERDGRATVFGHVFSGWGVLAAIAGVPVDKSHRPREPIRLRRVALASGAPATSPPQADDEGSPTSGSGRRAR